MMDRDHMTSTESGVDRGFSAAKEILSVPGQAIAGVTGPVTDAAQGALSASKLVLAETGVWRQIALTGGATRTGADESGWGFLSRSLADKQNVKRSQLDSPVVTGPVVKRTDADADSYMSIGSYLMPLSFDISVSGDKLIASSQLVDGPTIFERIANRPTKIDINFRLESKPDAEFALPSGYTDPLVIIDSVSKAAADLTRMFREIYLEDSVFEIVNPILNGSFGITNVAMESYSVRPQQGSSMWEVSLRLFEVDTTYALLYVENSDGAQAEPPTAKTTTQP